MNNNRDLLVIDWGLVIEACYFLIQKQRAIPLTTISKSTGVYYNGLKLVRAGGLRVEDMAISRVSVLYNFFIDNFSINDLKKV